jgi:hypothetical protein
MDSSSIADDSSSAALLGDEKHNRNSMCSSRSFKTENCRYIACPIALIGLNLVGTLVLLVGVVALFPFVAHQIHDFGTAAADASVATTCGSSAAEAVERGCHFDVINFGWFPPACWDKELYETTLNNYNWTWYSTEYEPLAMDQVQDGVRDRVLTTRGFHLVHCTYAWQKFTRDVLMNRPLDEWSARFNHARHCSRKLLETPHDALHEIKTSAKMWFPKCGLSTDDKLILLTLHKSSD